MTVRAPAELFDLTGRTAVVTGASSGLGARFAAVLAAAGATVWTTARRKDRLHELAADQPLFRPVAADLGTEDGRRTVIDTVRAGSGTIDLLINNAGVDSGAKPADETSERFAEVLETNLVGPFHLARMAAEVAGPQGLAVVNVSSILGLVSAAPMGGASYAASKAGLLGLTRELAGHWGRRGVRVNALAPGWFRTEMNDELFADERSVRWIGRNTMLGRAGDPAELDTALLFLCSPASSYLTGQILTVDGGWTAR